MGKTVLAEESLKEYASKLIANKEFVVGLVLGQITSQNYFVIHLVKTPLQDEDNEGKDTLPQKKTNSKAIEDWEPSLVALHAKQVTRMLLGGLEVLGIFICSPTDAIPTTTLTALKKILVEVRKAFVNSPYKITREENDQLLIHVSCVPNKITCKTIDVTVSLASPKSTDLKFQSTPIKWHMLRCQVAVDLPISVSKEAIAQPFINQLKKGLEPFSKMIWNATPVVNSILRKKEELLDSSESKGNRGKRMEMASSTSSYEVDLLLEPNCVKDNAEDGDHAIIERICGASVQIRGTIEGRAYITGNPTVGTAIQCLKQDIVRSLISRCEVHCEDMLVIEEEQQEISALDRVVVHELPCRIFAPLPNHEILVSDYIFPGETADDSLCAFQEVLGIDVGVEDVETNFERLPESSDLQIPSQDSNHDASSGHISGQQLNTSYNYTFIGLSIAIACIAGATSYYAFLN